MKTLITITAIALTAGLYAEEEINKIDLILDSQVELYEAVDALNNRLDMYELVVPQLIQELRTQLTDMEFALGTHHIANYNMMQSRLRTIELLLGLGKKPQPATPTPNVPAQTSAMPTIAPQFLMAPNVRNLTNNELIEEFIGRVKASGLTGMHIPMQCSWYGFAYDDYDEIKDFALFDAAFEMLENVRRHCERDGLWLHVWIHGDVESRQNPLYKWAAGSPTEIALYKRINREWGGKPNISFGVGFDLQEWLTIEHAQLIKQHLPDVLVSMRHPDSIYDHIADIPSIQQRRPTEADLVAFRAKYTDAPFIFTEDRFRQKWFNVSDDGHFTREQQQVMYDVCVRENIAAIWGKLPADFQLYRKGHPDFRYGSGSEAIQPPFRQP